MEVAEFNITVNDSIFNISKGRFEVGSIENELLQSNFIQKCKNIFTSASLNYQRALENFKGLGIDDETEIDIVVPDVAREMYVDVDKALDLATKNNSTSLLFDLNRLLADQTYDQARKNTGFSANLQASFGLNQTSKDIIDLYNDPQNRQFFNIGFQIPIFNWGKNQAEIKSARNEQQETANTIAYQKLQFELSVKSTVREFLQLRDQVELAQISDDIAARRYDVAKNRYLIGKIDITNLFIAQNEKDQARRSYSCTSYVLGRLLQLAPTYTLQF